MKPHVNKTATHVDILYVATILIGFLIFYYVSIPIFRFVLFVLLILA